MEIHQTQVHEWLDLHKDLVNNATSEIQLQEWLNQKMETLVSELSTNTEIIHPFAMVQFSVWLANKEIEHETRCQMYEFFIQTLEAYIELPPSLSSNEVWKNGESISFSRYDISNQGRVRNNSNKILLNGTKNIGYVNHHLVGDDNTKKHISAHKLVAMLFMCNPDNKSSVDHINRIENDNRCRNLRWATKSEQALNRKNRDCKYHAVYQYDLENNLIKKWNSTKEVLTEIDGSSSRLMNACSKGLVYRNYRWYYDYLVEVDETEEWRSSYLEGHEPFEISSKGRIRRPNGKIHEGSENDRYPVVRIRNLVTEEYDPYRIHTLVATAFLGKHDGLEVNHKNGNKRDNRVENLEFVTHRRNVQHAFENGLIKAAAKAVLQIDPTNDNVIAQYRSINDANSSTKIGVTSIACTCQGLQNLAGGFRWKYVDGDDKEQIKKELLSRANKPVRQIDPKTGEMIAEYPSAKIASLETRISYASIGNVCRGTTKTGGGFRWEYC